MRAARRLFLLSISAAGASAVIAPRDAFACQCLEEYWGDMVARVDVIFRGRVISDTPLLQTEPRNLRGFDEIDAHYMSCTRLDVLEVIKGDLGTTVEIVRPYIYSVCGRLLPAGYIVQVAAVSDPEHGLRVAPCDMRDDPDGRLTEFMRTTRP